MFVFETYKFNSAKCCTSSTVSCPPNAGRPIEHRLAFSLITFFIHPQAQTSEKKSRLSVEITDMATGAQSVRPKGNTLSTTTIQTKVPFLLKGRLREYQLIDLDWLVQIYEKKLNGVLADEISQNDPDSNLRCIINKQTFFILDQQLHVFVFDVLALGKRITDIWS